MARGEKTKQTGVNRQQFIHFGQFLRARRARLGKTIEQIHQECGVSEQLLEALEQGKSKNLPEAKTLDRMAESYQSNGKELRWRVGYWTLEQYNAWLATQGRSALSMSEVEAEMSQLEAEDARPRAAGRLGGEKRLPPPYPGTPPPAPPPPAPVHSPPEHSPVPAAQPVADRVNEAIPGLDEETAEAMGEAITFLKMATRRLERALERRRR